MEAVKPKKKLGGKPLSSFKLYYEPLKGDDKLKGGKK